MFINDNNSNLNNVIQIRQTRYNNNNNPENNRCISKEMKDTNSNATNSSIGYGLVDFPLASVYSPIQTFTELYDCETGLSRGTIFSKLDLPFICGGMSGGVNRG